MVYNYIFLFRFCLLPLLIGLQGLEIDTAVVCTPTIRTRLDGVSRNPPSDSHSSTLYYVFQATFYVNRHVFPTTLCIISYIFKGIIAQRYTKTGIYANKFLSCCDWMIIFIKLCIHFVRQMFAQRSRIGGILFRHRERKGSVRVRSEYYQISTILRLSLL